MTHSTPPPDAGTDRPSADSLLASGVIGLDDDGLADRVRDLHELRNRVDAALAETSGSFDARVVWARDGARSGPGWIAARTAASYGRAKTDIGLGRALRAMPVTAEAFDEGRLSREQVDALVKHRKGLEGAFGLVEAILVDQVARTTAAAAHRFLRRWAAETRERLGIDDDGTEPPVETGRVHLSASLDGVWHLAGALEPEQGEIVSNVLDAQIDSMFQAGVFSHDDGKCLSERRAIALVEVVARASRGGDYDGCARPLVLGIIDLRPADVPPADAPPADVPPTDAPPADAHAGETAPDDTAPDDTEADDRTAQAFVGLGELSKSGVVARSDIERWICEGTFQPIVVGSPDDKLRMGMRIRIANAEQRQALRVRDGHCQFAACTMAAEHCQPHHVTFWEHDGPTDVENLVLLCRFHHKVVHRRHYVVTRRPDGRVDIRRPDGTRIIEARPTDCDIRLTRPPPARARDPIDTPDPTAVAEERCIRKRIDTLAFHARSRRTIDSFVAAQLRG